MDKLIEQQREHFNSISKKYFSARSLPNPARLKAMIWRHFLKRNQGALREVHRVLEPMCGAAEGYDILRANLGNDFEYVGFDYSENMVELARQAHPKLRIEWHDVTAYASGSERYDLIILIGGLHHVYTRTRTVLENLRKSLREGGCFISFEPTHNNFIARYARKRIYASNELFDPDTEQGFEYSELQNHFSEAGFRKLDEVYPGLLAYVLYYNPDAFPLLNRGGSAAVNSLFAVDRLGWANWLGRKLSFATLSLWTK